MGSVKEKRAALRRVLKGEGSVFESQFESAGILDGVDPSIAQFMVEQGLEDGKQSDDVVPVKRGKAVAVGLDPSQKTMRLDQALGMALGMLDKQKIGGDLGAIISADGHIMDGHHRWAAAILAGGKSAKVGGYFSSLPGKDLLRVLNVLSKGKFNVRNGRSGSGNISDFNPANVKARLEDFAFNGIGGEFPLSARTVQEILIDSFGTVDLGINRLSKNAKLISKAVPGWAPSRKQMPVIDPWNVPSAVKTLNKGEVDWAPPYSDMKKGSSFPFRGGRVYWNE